MLRGAIFDMDGTLLDSMFIWVNMGEIYLRSIGYEPRPDLNETFRPLSLLEAARYFRREYGVPFSEEKIMTGINRMVEVGYREQARPKPGVKDFLTRLRDRGVKMCVATATDRYLVEIALTRCGIREYFSGIFTCTDVGSSKSQPQIFRTAMAHLGTEKSQTAVFEDAVHAARTARDDGFPLVGVFDSYEERQEALRTLSDCYLKDYLHADHFWKFAAAL